jgi:hypothetical protein
MKLVLLSLCLMPLLAQAEKKIDLKPNATKEAKKPEDPGSATHMLYESPQKLEAETGKKSAKLKVSSTCTDGLGMVHKHGDKSYEACLRNMDKSAPTKTLNDKNRPSMGISIGQ